MANQKLGIHVDFACPVDDRRLLLELLQPAVELAEVQEEQARGMREETVAKWRLKRLRHMQIELTKMGETQLELFQ